MRIAVLGADSPLVNATRATLVRLGHEISATAPDCAVCFPAPLEHIRDDLARAAPRRLVVRSHAAVYGASPKNPGLLAEDRVSLLPDRAPERRWLELESLAAGHPNSAIIRLTNLLDPAEGDPIVYKLTRRAATAPAGRDPNLQFLALDDAAALLAAACESAATGIFNGAPNDSVTLKRALAAAGAASIPSLRPDDHLSYTWTVSSDRARRDLGWTPRRSTAEALADFVAANPGANPDLLSSPCDHWGLDPRYIRAWSAWFRFLRNVYWRIDHEGMDHIPLSGRALFVSNHRGFMPLDAVMHLSLILTHRGRIPRFLIIHSLLRMPFLSNFLTKLGGVIASRENATRLFAAENLVGIFPEGIRGAFSPYRDAYRLRDFAKSGFARIAIENHAPVIPAAVVGHAEIFPILGRINSSYITREWGWPYLPIAPMFPLAPIPLPSKWHVRVLPPVPFQGLSPSDADKPRLVREFSAHIQQLMQHHIDEMRARRKHIFWGRILDRPAPTLIRNLPLGDAR